MCGIWAIFGYPEDTMDLVKDFQSFRGRGPDSYRLENINHYPEVALGFHRLAIVGDLDGMQPIRVKGMQHISMLLNGEIYNHKMLGKDFKLDFATHCDVECVIHLYQRLGMREALAQLDGVFGIILVDILERKIFLARDTFGVRPVFYLTTPDGLLAAASEVKGVINIAHRLHYADCRLHTLPVGSVMEFSFNERGHILPGNQLHRFHKIGDPPRYRTLVSPDERLDIMANIRNLLTAAVQKRLMSERRIGCLLSGGLDSSLISGILVRCMKEAGITYPVQTFCIGLEDSVDAVAARKVADYLGTEHYEVGFTAEEGIKAVEEVIYRIETYDVTTIRASVGMYLVSRYIQKKTDTIIVFSGEGSDEVCQGYIYFHKAPNQSDADAEGRRLLQDLHYFDVLRADRTMSGCGLEGRVPFLDHRFSSYYLSLPAEERIPREGCEKFLLRKSFSGLDYIPEEILWRPKEAFSDGVSSTEKPWFEILQDHVETLVTDEQLANAATTFPFNPPYSKESYFYRTIFEKHYPGQSHLIPYFWMPKWLGATDPSARTLGHYRSSEVSLEALDIQN